MNAVVETKLLKLDLGAGKNKRAGFLGVDSRKFDGVDIVTDLTQPWPWESNSVEEVNMSHVLEHFTGVQRAHVFNELHRVLAPGGKATITTPHWASNRAYGDFTHQWPPVSEMLYYYISKAWREVNAPHTDQKWNADGYACDFEATWGYVLHQDLLPRNQQYQMHAMTFWKEACQDMIATITARK
jgi:SAM-dependent methyltransferase